MRCNIIPPPKELFVVLGALVAMFGQALAQEPVLVDTFEGKFSSEAVWSSGTPEGAIWQKLTTNRQALVTSVSAKPKKEWVFGEGIGTASAWSVAVHGVLMCQEGGAIWAFGAGENAVSLVRVGNTLRVKRGDTTLLESTSIATLDLDENLYAVVAKETTLALYINGTLNKAVSLEAGQGIVDSTWQLGASAEGMAVDAVAVYAQALSGDDIAALAQRYPKKEGEYLALPEVMLPEGWGAAYAVPRVAHHFASTGDTGMADNQPLFRMQQKAGTDNPWLVGIRQNQTSGSSVSGGYSYTKTLDGDNALIPSVYLVSEGGKARELTAGHVISRKNGSAYAKNFKGDAILIADGTTVSNYLSGAGYAFIQGTKTPSFEGNTLVEVRGGTTAPHMAGAFAVQTEANTNRIDFAGSSTLRIRTVMGTASHRAVGGSYNVFDNKHGPFRYEGTARTEILIPEAEGTFAASVYGGSYNNYGDAAKTSASGAASLLLDAPKVTFTGKVIAGNGGTALTQSNATATLTVKAAKFDGATVLPYEACAGEATSTLEILGATDLSKAATIGDFTSLRLGANLTLGGHRLPNTTLIAPTEAVTLAVTLTAKELQDAKVTLCKADFTSVPETLTVAPGQEGWALGVEGGALVYKRESAANTHTWAEGDASSWFEDWVDGDSATFTAYEGGRTITLADEINANAITLEGANTLVGPGAIRAATLTFGTLTFDLANETKAASISADAVTGQTVAVTLPAGGLKAPHALLKVPQQDSLTFTLPEGDTTHFVYYAEGAYWVAQPTAFAQPLKATISKNAEWTALAWTDANGTAIPTVMWEKTGATSELNAELEYAAANAVLTTAAAVELKELTVKTKTGTCYINTNQLTVDTLSLQVSDGGSSGEFLSNGDGNYPRVRTLTTIGKGIVYHLDPGGTNEYTFTGAITGEGTLRKRAGSATVILTGELRDLAKVDYHSASAGTLFCKAGGTIRHLKMASGGDKLRIFEGTTLTVTERLELNNQPNVFGNGTLMLAKGAAFTVAGTGNTLTLNEGARIAIAEDALVKVSGNGIDASRTAPLIACKGKVAAEAAVAERFTFEDPTLYVAAETGGYLLKAYPTPAETPEGLSPERQLAIWKVARDAGLSTGYALTVEHSKASVADVLSCFNLTPVADTEAGAVTFVCDFGIAAIRYGDPEGKDCDVKVMLRNGTLVEGARLVLLLNGAEVEATPIDRARDSEDAEADWVQWFRVQGLDASQNRISVKATTATTAE